MRSPALALALLLACGACGGEDPTPKALSGVGWVQLGEGVYRMDDPARGVTCYAKTSYGAELSCLRTTIPPVTPEANDAK